MSNSYILSIVRKKNDVILDVSLCLHLKLEVNMTSLNPGLTKRFYLSVIFICMLMLVTFCY